MFSRQNPSGLDTATGPETWRLGPMKARPRGEYPSASEAGRTRRGPARRAEDAMARKFPDPGTRDPRV